MKKMYTSSKEFIEDFRKNPINANEGGCCAEQIEYFWNLLRTNTSIKTVFEIGFNTGLSSAAFLESRPDIHVLSVDIGEHEYVLKGKKWIDSKYPGRHTLIIGDSTCALPEIMKQFPSYTPDMIYIDGGHDDPVPRKDLENCLQLCKPSTWFIIDDVVEWMPGIIQPLNNLLSEKKIVALDQQRSGIHGWLTFKKIF